MILVCRCGLRWVAVSGEPLPALCIYCRAWTAKPQQKKGTEGGR